MSLLLLFAGWGGVSAPAAVVAASGIDGKKRRRRASDDDELSELEARIVRRKRRLKRQEPGPAVEIAPVIEELPVAPWLWGGLPFADLAALKSDKKLLSEIQDKLAAIAKAAADEQRQLEEENEIAMLLLGDSLR